MTERGREQEPEQEDRRGKEGGRDRRRGIFAGMTMLISLTLHLPETSVRETIVSAWGKKQPKNVSLQLQPFFIVRFPLLWCILVHLPLLLQLFPKVFNTSERKTHTNMPLTSALTKKQGKKKTTTVCFNSCQCTLLFRAFEREKTAE